MRSSACVLADHAEVERVRRAGQVGAGLGRAPATPTPTRGRAGEHDLLVRRAVEPRVHERVGRGASRRCPSRGSRRPSSRRRGRRSRPGGCGRPASRRPGSCGRRSCARAMSREWPRAAWARSASRVSACSPRLVRSTLTRQVTASAAASSCACVVGMSSAPGHRAAPCAARAGAAASMDHGGHVRRQRPATAGVHRGRAASNDALPASCASRPARRPPPVESPCESGYPPVWTHSHKAGRRPENERFGPGYSVLAQQLCGPAAVAASPHAVQRRRRARAATSRGTGAARAQPRSRATRVCVTVVPSTAKSCGVDDSVVP